MSKWEMMKLGEVATYINGYAFKPSDWGKGGVPIIRIQDLTGNAYETNCFNGGYSPRYEINDGDILVAWSASLGVYEWNGGKALLNQHIFKVVFDKVKVSKRYFLYAVNKVLLESSNQTHGSTMKHITKSRFDNLLIPLPPLDEQKRIAEELDKIRELIAKRKSQLQKLDLLVKAKFVEMFGDPVSNPMGWKEGCLSEVITFLTSGSRGWSSFFSASGEMFLTIKNVKNNKILTSNMQYVIAPKGKEAERTKVQPYDLLISITADLGRTGVVDKSISEYGAYINQHLSLIRLDMKKVNPYYISYFLETPMGKKQFESKNQSAVKAGLNFEAIKSLLVLYPPLNLQNQFADYVTKVEQAKTKLQQGLEQLETLYKARLQEYFG